ncbi:MAG: L,D-transpeptidase [Gammaproteobacteria bacterium]|nr:L,D-transpeptidase [Gammaproteobacteria bacterium]
MDQIIDIDISKQRLKLKQGERTLLDAPVSTGLKGAGELMDSERTPRGWHVVCEKIGEGAPMNTVFVGRKPTGELYSPELRQQQPGRDWILTRILWLSGAESGKNLNGNVDSRDRYIYIHGCPADSAVGAPGSRGCIRMRNDQIVELFNRVQVGTRVFIHE